MSDQSRAQFEAVVIERMKGCGYLEVEIRVECLARHGEGYNDGSIDAYWQFWQASRAVLEVELPEERGGRTTYTEDDARDAGYNLALEDCAAVIEAAGLKVKP